MQTENKHDNSIIPNPRNYVINLWNDQPSTSETEISNMGIYLSADYTNPTSKNNNDYIGITYMKSDNLTSIELPTDNPELMAEAVRICNSIESELRMLDNLMVEIIEDNDTENLLLRRSTTAKPWNVYAENYGCFRS